MADYDRNLVDKYEMEAIEFLADAETPWREALPHCPEVVLGVLKAHLCLAATLVFALEGSLDLREGDADVLGEAALRAMKQAYDDCIRGRPSMN